MKVKTKVILILVVISTLFLIISQFINTINIYNQNKDSILKDINTTFDNSVEYYYNETAKHNFIAIIGNNNQSITNFPMDSLFSKNKKISENNISTNSYILADTINKNLKVDTLKQMKKFEYKVIKGKKKVDSISNLKKLTHKIIMSFNIDTIDFKAFEKYFNKELKRKNINIDYQLQLTDDGKIKQKTKALNSKLDIIKIENKSTFLPNNNILKLNFENPTSIILKKSIFNLILTTLLVLFIIFLLVYMLWIIQKQKKIDEIKNDFISNITHELKTPITTIQAAIEGIKHFNNEKEEEKTNKYLDIAQNQNQKLNNIVEKILETATLDVNNLNLNYENTNMSNLLENLTSEFKQNNTFKKFTTNILTNISINIDSFHFQNVINNILDNAVKYGGNEINIETIQVEKNLLIQISDSGIIDSKERELIFEKFYRISQGNLHNTKGFGIGLYYARKIIELHQGKLELKPIKNTTFVILLPYEKN